MNTVWVKIQELMGSGVMIGAFILATTQALRKFIPRIDGWVTVVTTLVLSGTVCFLMYPDAFQSVGTALEAGRLAFVSWIVAIGTDSLATKYSAKAGGGIVDSLSALVSSTFKAPSDKE